MGAALQQGVQTTIGRTAALRAGLPVTVAGMSIDRQCASGLMAIATAAKQVIVDRMDVVVAGGVESISLVQTGGDAPRARPGAAGDAQRRLHADDRHRRDRRQALRHQPRALRRICASLAAAHRRRAGRRAASTTRSSRSPRRWPSRTRKPAKSRCMRSPSPRTRAIAPETTLEGLAKLEPVRGPGNVITAGNASQLSDGASACVVMEASLAEKRGLQPLGRYIGMAVAGTEPGRDGHRPGRSRCPSCSSASASRSTTSACGS